MTTYTNTIGTGGDFATLSLYWNTSATAIASGDVLVAEFLGGTHSIGATYNNTFSNLVGVDLVMKPVASAMHNGNWDEGVRIEPQTGQTGQMYFQTGIGNQDFKLTIQDLVWINPHADNGRIYINFDPTPGSGAQYDATLSFERCLIHASGSNPYEFTLVANNYDASSGGGVSALGNSTISLKNCVIEGFRDNGNVTRCFRTYGTTNVTFSAVGCTFHNASLYYSNSASAIENLHVHGCMFNQVGNTQGLGWEGFNTVAGSTSSFSDIIWTRSGQAGYVGDNWTTGASFNYDGTVTSGEVCFVGPSGPEGNYRLVADLDNLAVQYVEILNELPGRDITGYRKPRLSDAGAFQSISTSSTVHYVGTSSVTFTPDYTTLSLWRSGIYDDPILNGMTRTAVLADEVFEINADFGSYYTDGPRRVHHSITLSGLSRQDGNLNTGTVFHISDSIYGQYNRETMRFESRSPTDITLNVNDIVVSSTYSLNNFSLCYVRAANASFSQYTTSSNFGAYDLKSNFKNCIFILDASGRYLFTPVWHQTNLFTLDPNVDPSVAGRSDIIELGGVDTSYDNCVLIGPKNSYGRTDHNGNVGMLGIYIPNTTYGTSATLSMSSCTCVNTIFPLGRLPVVDNNFVGSMFYNDHTVLFTNGWNNLLTNINVTESRKLSNESAFGPTWRESISKFEDCIFSHASSYIAFRNGQTDLPIDASSFINCSFGKYFDFDGSARAGRVSFENNYVSSVSASYDFLDNFSEASIAYSLRKLSQSYSGYCIKVRRTSDNSEIDVGFDSNGDLNTSAITNHCGAASGYVSVWYDQTSNSVDATQSTSANQPLIYDGTSIITENGKPALSFHESRDTRLTFDTDLFEGTYVDLFAVLAVDLDGIYGTSHLASEGGGTNLYWHTGGRREFMYPADRFQVQGSSDDRFGINMQTERQCILELWSEPTKVRQRVNNIQRDQSQNRAPVAIPSGERSYIIGARSGNYFYNMNGRYQEFIIFPEDQDTSRDAIFDNLNNHYEASPLYFTPRNQ